MNSERSDIDVKVALEISNGGGYDDNNRRIEIILERSGEASFTAEVEAYGFDESDKGARAVSEALDLVALGIESALPDEVDPEAEKDEAIVQELIKAGVDEHIARGDGLKTVKMFALANPEVFVPAVQEPMHPQDPEKWSETWGKDDGTRSIQSFETPQHVRDARAARRAERKGFNPKPKGGQ